VRLRGKSCPTHGIGYPLGREKGISGTHRAARPSAGGCGVEDQVGRTGATFQRRWNGAQVMEILFKGLHTDVAARFRDQATAKLSRLEKLDQKAIRVDVEVSVERNPRLASQKERVELTIMSRGPAIRAEAAAEDRFAAFDIALAKLDSRLRRALDRRKHHHNGRGPDRVNDRISDRVGDPIEPEQLMLPEDIELLAAGSVPAQPASPPTGSQTAGSVVAIDADGDGPLVVRQKFHQALPIPIDQALLEMELVGHDFYLFHDFDTGLPSVVYRRRGYQYGVIRLVEDPALVDDSVLAGEPRSRAESPAPSPQSALSARSALSAPPARVSDEEFVPQGHRGVGRAV